MIMLNIPWRENLDCIKQNWPGFTWEEIFFCTCDNAKLFEPFQENDDVFEDEFQDENEIVVRDPAAVASRVGPSIQQEEALGMQPINEANEWTSTENKVSRW